jgi:hypothetical protein
VKRIESIAMETMNRLYDRAGVILITLLIRHGD